MEKMLVTSATYFIVKWAVGSFLHCALLLLVPDLNDHNGIDVLTHQLAGLGDGDGNLQHKAHVCTRDLALIHTRRTEGGWAGGVIHLLDSFGT